MEARWKGGDNMSLEAVQMVTETEQRALQRKAEAVEAAKKLVSDAEPVSYTHLTLPTTPYV